MYSNLRTIVYVRLVLHALSTNVTRTFDTYDVDGNGSVEFEEFTDMLVKPGVFSLLTLLTCRRLS